MNSTQSAVAPAASLQEMAELRVEVVSTYSEFLNLEPEWSRLVRQAEVNHPFLEHAWHRTWWECFGADSSLYVLVVKAQARVVAIVPLILKSIRLYGLSLRQLGFFYNSHVPRADFLIGSRRDFVYSAVWDHLQQNGAWDLLQLCQLPVDSPTRYCMAALARNSGYLTGSWISGASPYVSLGTPWEAYLQGLPAKHRSNLRNRWKRLNADAAVTLETITEEAGIDAAMDGGLHLEAAAWKGASGTAIQCNANTEKFYRSLAVRAAERGWLRLHFLRSASASVAFDYSLEYQNRIFLLKIGYDPSYSRFSPSNLLTLLLLEEAFRNGRDRFDFLGEEMDWKRCWTKTSLRHDWLYIFAAGWKGRLLHGLKFQVAPVVKQAGSCLSHVARMHSARHREESV